VSRVLGVDGGNTKTLAVVAGTDGRTLGAGRSGCSDIYSAPTPGDAIDAIVAATAEALAQAGVAGSEIAAATFSLAGADWPEDFALLSRALHERLGLPEPPFVVNDSIGALRAGAPDWTGIAVVSGTHNAIGARHPDGRVFHLGFWPDGAGGYEIGKAGLRAVYHAALGMGSATVLTERALTLYGAPDAIELLHEFTRRGGIAKRETDRLAPLVLDAADEDDAVAQAIVSTIGGILGRQGRACAEQLGLPLAGTRVVMTGSVFGHPTERLANATMAELPGAIAVRQPAPPVAGALLLALDRLGIEADPETVVAGLPSPASERRSALWAASPSRA
jgi:N-acetylglucosamine kinase-like BadF-type ATPase